MDYVGDGKVLVSLPLLSPNGQLPLLSSSGVGGESKREGVVTTVTNSGLLYIIQHCIQLS